MPDNQVGALDVTLRAAHELPSASAEFAKEVYAHPGQTAVTAVKTVASSAFMGAALGYIIPARGPAAALIGAAFTIPMVYGAAKRVGEAEDEANASNGNLDLAAKNLARSTVAGTVDLGLNLAGGYAGADIGHRVAMSDTLLGDLAQRGQKLILRGENESMLTASSWAGKFLSKPEFGEADLKAGISSKIDGASLKDKSLGILGKVPDSPNATLNDLVGESTATTKVEPTTALGRRLQQYGIASRTVERSLNAAPDSDLTAYFGSLHGHSRYSDGMGLPKDLYKRAQSEGQQITTITDHNHAAARGGVPKGDPRAGDEAGTPTVADNPIEYAQTFADAAATTNDKHLSLVGTELGTIGQVRGGHSGEGHSEGMQGAEFVDPTIPKGTKFDLEEARQESNAAAHMGGVNHINLFEVPTFFLSEKKPPTLLDQFLANRASAASARIESGNPGLMDNFLTRIAKSRAEATVKPPDVVRYNDGDYKALVDHLDKLKDTTGKTPVIQLNHPRYLADENPNTPANLRGFDYGQRSFKDLDEWRTRFADKYVRQIELIKGGALNPNPVDKVPTGHLDPTSFAGYLDKGVHASPTFGRDFHFGDPVGNPGATGIYAKGLTKEHVLDALRDRRTIATTSGEKLSGMLTANDKFVMGSILDQSAVDQLALKMRIDGVVDPKAEYYVKLWGDKKIGDGNLAETIQEQKMTGSQLLSADKMVSFDPIKNKVGQSSAYYVEVGRTDPITANVDRMWTAPIWIEPLQGAQHSLATRWMAGVGSQVLNTGF